MIEAGLKTFRTEIFRIKPVGTEIAGPKPVRTSTCAEDSKSGNRQQQSNVAHQYHPDRIRFISRKTVQLQYLCGETDEIRSGYGRSLLIFYHAQALLVRVQRSLTKVMACHWTGMPGASSSGPRNADGSQLRVDQVPSGPPPTTAALTLTQPFSLGVHNLNISVTDGKSAPVACTTTATVRDTTPPAVSASVGSPVLWTPDHTMVNVGFAATAQDQCSGPQPVSVKVFSNESQFATGSGNFSPDASGGAGGLLLRSERTGGGNGRVYLIVASSVDPAGNRAFTCTTAVVSHDQTDDSLQAVQALAATAQGFCVSNGGSAPAGYFAIDGTQ